MKLKSIYLFLSLIYTGAYSQTTINKFSTSQYLSDTEEEFIVQCTSNQEKNYGRTKTINLDTTIYTISLPKVVDTNQVIFNIYLVSFSTKVTVTFGTTSLVNYYYSTKNKIKNEKYQIAFDNFDATVGNLIGKKVLIIYDKKQDSLIVQNADSIVSTLKDIPSGLLESVKTYFSNDFFTGFFNVFIRTGVAKGETSGRKWTRLHEKESLVMPNYSDKTYTISSLKKDSILVSVTGVSNYRNTTWTNRLESKTYGSGIFDGLLTIKKDKWIPYAVSLNYQFKIPKNRYSDYDEIIQAKTKITFAKIHK